MKNNPAYYALQDLKETCSLPYYVNEGLDKFGKSFFTIQCPKRPEKLIIHGQPYRVHDTSHTTSHITVYDQHYDDCDVAHCTWLGTLEGSTKNNITLHIFFNRYGNYVVSKYKTDKSGAQRVFDKNEELMLQKHFSPLIKDILFEILYRVSQKRFCASQKAEEEYKKLVELSKDLSTLKRRESYMSCLDNCIKHYKAVDHWSFTPRSVVTPYLEQLETNLVRREWTESVAVTPLEDASSTVEEPTLSLQDDRKESNATVKAEVKKKEKSKAADNVSSKAAGLCPFSVEVPESLKAEWSRIDKAIDVLPASSREIMSEPARIIAEITLLNEKLQLLSKHPDDKKDALWVHDIDIRLKMRDKQREATITLNDMVKQLMDRSDLDPDIVALMPHIVSCSTMLMPYLIKHKAEFRVLEKLLQKHEDAMLFINNNSIFINIDKDKRDMTMLELIIFQYHENAEVLELFLDYGANPNDQNGRALLFAIYMNLDQHVSALLKYGANPNLTDKNYRINAMEYVVKRYGLDAGASVDKVIEGKAIDDAVYRVHGISVLRILWELNKHGADFHCSISPFVCIDAKWRKINLQVTLFQCAVFYSVIFSHYVPFVSDVMEKDSALSLRDLLQACAQILFFSVGSNIPTSHREIVARATTLAQSQVLDMPRGLFVQGRCCYFMDQIVKLTRYRTFRHFNSQSFQQEIECLFIAGCHKFNAAQRNKGEEQGRGTI